MVLPSPYPAVSYPALLWHEGYVYLARTPLELCAHPRSLFQEAVQHARSGEIHLVDAEGRRFDVVDWARIRSFGGINGIALRLLGSIFAAPVLANETRLALPEFKKTLVRAIRGAVSIRPRQSAGYGDHREAGEGRIPRSSDARSSKALKRKN
jgi:hypothetical protein